jgi:hypothetical protein
MNNRFVPKMVNHPRANTDHGTAGFVHGTVGPEMQCEAVKPLFSDSELNFCNGRWK